MVKILVRLVNSALTTTQITLHSACSKKNLPWLIAEVLHFRMLARKLGVVSWAHTPPPPSSSKFELIRLMPRNFSGSGLR